MWGSVFSSEGLLRSKDEIEKILLDEQRRMVRVETDTDKWTASSAILKRFIALG